MGNHAVPLVALAALALATACSRTPSEPAAPDAAATPPPEPTTQRHPRDEKGNLIPHTPAPPLTDADIAPVGRAPDWDLDPRDPARDYVERYVQSTRRYGDETPCVHATASRPDGDRAIVEARDASDGACKGTHAVRDAFAVRVAADRLALVDPSRGAPLANWPDGSDPAGAPSPAPRDEDMTTWRSPIKDALKAMQLVPVRLQWYGRGSYPVISLAGWHGDVTPDAKGAKLAAIAKALCDASKGRPLGLFAGMDRQTILRVRCPDARWEKL